MATEYPCRIILAEGISQHQEGQAYSREAAEGTAMPQRQEGQKPPGHVIPSYTFSGFICLL